jgi:hypothetical protein
MVYSYGLQSPIQWYILMGCLTAAFGSISFTAELHFVQLSTENAALETGIFILIRVVKSCRNNEPVFAIATGIIKPDLI